MERDRLIERERGGGRRRRRKEIKRRLRLKTSGG